jgi:hypothetical protein
VGPCPNFGRNNKKKFSVERTVQKDPRKHSRKKGNRSMASDGNNAETESTGMAFFTENSGFYILFKEAYMSSNSDYVAGVIVTLVYSAVTVWAIHFMSNIENKAFINESITWKLMGSASRVVTTGLHLILMLIAMTFNVGIFVSVCVGAGIGLVLIQLTNVSSCCLCVRPSLACKNDDEVIAVEKMRSNGIDSCMCESF